VARWIDRVEAGNLYVNRGTTGAIVQRQPFGGWKKSAVGPGAKAGGPSYLFGLGSWTDRAPASGRQLDRLGVRAVEAARAAGASPTDVDWLRAALATDITAWAQEFGVARDVSGLEHEQNVLRYQAVPVTVRWEGERVVELARVVAAGLRAGASLVVSAPRLPAPLGRYLDATGVAHHEEDDAAWAARAAAIAVDGGRVRLIGGSAQALAEATHGAPAVAVYAGEVVSAGRVELLAFLREQAVSICAHRFGTPRRYEIPAPAGA
jgi:RHH-type proline utilization regulon transcriptional repressor/proline dehydrogenase/delta 1-pyrroline-5-carboxylate dehydrogenase